ncbi:MAG: hypothetical protein LLG00_12135 [Planctomycetaceae bacterium]|nr:hypothetical protein [Planctomycetaceae bacterium]
MENPERTIPPRSTLPSAPRRQYTLAGLLSYMLAASVYLSMFVSVRPLLDWESRYGRSWWPGATSAAVAWLTLWFLYRRWRLPHAQRVHYAGPQIILCLLLLFWLATIGHWLVQLSLRNPPPFECVMGTIAALLFGCGVSAAVSLPTATIMLLYLGTRSASGHASTESDVSGQ